MDFQNTFVKAMRDRLEKGTLDAVPYCFVTGDRANRLPNSCNVANVGRMKRSASGKKYTSSPPSRDRSHSSS